MIITYIARASYKKKVVRSEQVFYPRDGSFLATVPTYCLSISIAAFSNFGSNEGLLARQLLLATAFIWYIFFHNNNHHHQLNMLKKLAIVNYLCIFRLSAYHYWSLTLETHIQAASCQAANLPLSNWKFSVLEQGFIVL